MEEIIDFHVHPYRTFEENFNMYKESFDLSWDEAVADMKKSGITHICGSVITREKYNGWDYIKKLNDAALEMWKADPEFYTPGFHVHPGYLKESLDEVERMHKAGVKLLGELVPYMHGWEDYRYDCKELQEIIELAGQYGMVISYHTMNEWHDEMENMIKNNPTVNFVAAHPGQKADCVKHVERMEKYDNAYLDISGTGLFRYGVLKHLCKTVGGDRILFGTDYPMTNPKMYIEAVGWEDITDQEKEAIFAGNAKRLLFS